MIEYRVSQIADVKLEQEPSDGDGMIHLTVRDLPPMVLCFEEVQSLKGVIDDFLKGVPNA
jgi:hypothetical protein